MSADQDERRVRGQPRSAASPTRTSARVPATPRTPCAGSQVSEPCDVVDLGAGTGKLTRSLVALGHRVTAVEPLPEMLDQLRAARSRGDRLEGGAEAIPLPAESADVVTVAQAFHWFDHGPALVEIARVLRPGGRLALVWNVRDESEPWVRRAERRDGGDGRASTRGRSSRSTRAACSGRSSMRPSASSRRSTARRCASSSSPAATAPCSPRRSARRCCRTSTTCSRSTPVTASLGLPYLTECFRATRR